MVAALLSAVALALAGASAPAAVSPDGRLLAYEVVAASRRQVLVEDLTADRLVLRAPLAGSPAQRILWGGAAPVVVVAAPGAAGNGRAAAFALDIPRRSARRLVTADGLAQFERVTAAPYAGGQAVFLEARAPGGGRSLYRLRPGDAAAERVAGGQGALGWIVGPEGEPVAEARADRTTGLWTLRVRRAGVWREVASLPLAPEPQLIGLGRDGRAVVYAAQGDDGWSWREARLDDAPAAPPLPVAAGDAPILDPVDGRLIGRITDRGEGPGTEFFAEADNHAWRLATGAFPNDRLSLVSWDAARLRIVLRIERPGGATGLAFVDLAKAQASWLWPADTGR